jgi:hypothetical protein
MDRGAIARGVFARAPSVDARPGDNLPGRVFSTASRIRTHRAAFSRTFPAHAKHSDLHIIAGQGRFVLGVGVVGRVGLEPTTGGL